MADTKDAKKVLLEQAAALELEVDGRWSVETLAEKVLEAQEAKEESEREAIRSAKKIPVLLKRNAFVTADEKHFKGEVVEVPVPMAKEWIRLGVAERADPLPEED